MNPYIIQSGGKDIGEYPPRYQTGYYDVDKSLERRCRAHQRLTEWIARGSEFRLWLITLEEHWLHLPHHLSHAHPKSVTIHQHSRR